MGNFFFKGWADLGSRNWERRQRPQPSKEACLGSAGVDLDPKDDDMHAATDGDCISDDTLARLRR
jgi:hypothetical protein